MRIGIDATSWPNRRGYGRFVRNAVSRLVALDPSNSYVLHIDEASADSAALPPGAEVRVVRCRKVPAQAASARSSRPVTDLLRLGAAASRDSLDAFLFPSVYTYYPVVAKPTVVGFHDAISDQFPELTLPDRRSRAFMGAKKALARRGASRIFTVSQASRAVLCERYGLAPEAVPVVSEAPDPAFAPRPPEKVAATLAPLGLEPGSYLVFAGGISPHKNIETLLEAYARLSRSRRDAPALVLVGELEADPYLSASAAVRTRIAELGLEDRVHLPGFVPDDGLASLYSGALATVLPSLVEGFGLPAVEAAACGTAVVLSDIPAHRETLGEGALYFPPRDAGALEALLRALLDEPGLRNRLAARGRDTVARFSWDASAEALRRVLEETVADRARTARVRASRIGRRARRGMASP